MRAWSYSINRTFGRGYIHLVDQPWWLAALDFLNDHLLGALVRALRYLPLPNLFKRQRGLPNDTALYGWRDEYGTVGDWLGMHTYGPALCAIVGLQRKYEIEVDVGYDKVKALFATHDPEFFADDGDSGEVREE